MSVGLRMKQATRKQEDADPFDKLRATLRVRMTT
jgi:hypothetical protein